MYGILTPRRQREEDWESDQLEQDTIKLKELENSSLKCTHIRSHRRPLKCTHSRSHRTEDKITVAMAELNGYGDHIC